MFDSLFSPGRIGWLRLDNRVVKSPNTTATAHADGSVTQRTVDHYRRLAQGGAGLVIMEYCYVDDAASKSIHCQTGISRLEHIAGLAWLAAEVKAEGPRVGVQLNHSGRQKYLGTRPMMSATSSSWSVAEAPYGVTPEPMSHHDIREVVEAFAAAAERAVQAGFDLVEIHAAHGYLLSNFLSGYTNWRLDEYGGPVENRSRLLREVVTAVRSRIPSRTALSVRLPATDYEPDGFSVEDAVEVGRCLEPLGVDVLHVSGGHHERLELEVSPWFISPAPHRSGWERIKAAVSIPVIASGSIGDPDLADEIVRTGSADFIGLGRPLLADPDWARKAEQGRQLEIVPCVRCNDGCMDRGLNLARSVNCTVNPEVTKEGRYDIEHAIRSLAVGVVGGGPAGLRAAAGLADRGHRVTLFEADQLGGVLGEFEGYRSRAEFWRLRQHLVHEVRRRAVDVVHGRAGVESLVDGGFDAVLVATGAPRRTFDGAVSDARRLLSSADLVTRRDEICGTVIVVGGGLEGCDVAIRLSELEDVQIEIVERGSTLLGGTETRSDKAAMPQRLADAGVKVHLDTEVTEVHANGVLVMTAGEKMAQPSLLTADWVIMALGRVEQGDHLEESLRQAGVRVKTIGSAIEPGRLMEALHSGFHAARSL